MTPELFQDVILRDENFRHQEIGTLSIGRDFIQFDSQQKHLIINNIQFVSLEKPSKLALGDWVKVQYGESPQNSTIYLNKRHGSSKENPIDLALRHFPNSNKFDCRVWARLKRRFALSHASAPRKHWGFTIPKKGAIASTRDQSLTLSARGLRKRESPFSEIMGYKREVFTVKQQLSGIGLDTLILSTGLGGLLSIVYLIFGLESGKATLMGALNLFVLFTGIGFVLCLLYALPTLLNLQTLALFTLKLQSEKDWEFGVPVQDTEKVVEIFRSYGLEQLSNGVVNANKSPSDSPGMQV